MVTIKVQSACNDDAKHADFVISITSPGGTAGIESVVVTALDGSVVGKQTPQGCPSDFQFSVGAAYTALPVYVAVTECQAGVD